MSSLQVCAWVGLGFEHPAAASRVCGVHMVGLPGSPALCMAAGTFSCVRQCQTASWYSPFGTPVMRPACKGHAACSQACWLSLMFSRWAGVGKCISVYAILQQHTQVPYCSSVLCCVLSCAGGAGVGKSFTVDALVQQLLNRRRTVAVTASTGTAALNINGMTVHRCAAWAGLHTCCCPKFVHMGVSSLCLEAALDSAACRSYPAEVTNSLKSCT